MPPNGWDLPVLRSLPLKVHCLLLASPHTVDSHKLTVNEFLKSLLHTRMLNPATSSFPQLGSFMDSVPGLAQLSPRCPISGGP